MKKLFYVLFTLSLCFGLAACKKDKKEDGKKKVDENGLTDDIKNLVPKAILDKMQQMGMPIYGGDNPPDINGLYSITPFILQQTDVPGDIIGTKFSDLTVKFYNQDNKELKISSDYSQTNGEEGVGLGSYVVGKDCEFSVFIEGESTYQGYKAKTVYVVSGKMENKGISDLKWANFMVDDNGDPGNVFISNGEGRVFWDSDKWSEQTGNNKEWYAKLPDCPCEYKANDYPREEMCGTWENCGSASSTYHYGATYEIRWFPSGPEQPGQQCTYDAAGKLITGGIAAGSPDRSSPLSCGFWDWLTNNTGTVSSFLDHKANDMEPWETVACWYYLTAWPANHSKCSGSNIITSIDYCANMKKMIGNMTCEEATLLIKSANETTPPIIDVALRNFITGTDPSLTAQQIKTKLQAWKGSLLCSTEPKLCAAISKAINNL